MFKNEVDRIIKKYYKTNSYFYEYIEKYKNIIEKYKDIYTDTTDIKAIATDVYGQNYKFEFSTNIIAYLYGKCFRKNRCWINNVYTEPIQAEIENKMFYDINYYGNIDLVPERTYELFCDLNKTFWNNKFSIDKSKLLKQDDFNLFPKNENGEWNIQINKTDSYFNMCEPCVVGSKYIFSSDYIKTHLIENDNNWIMRFIVPFFNFTYYRIISNINGRLLMSKISQKEMIITHPKEAFMNDIIHFFCNYYYENYYTKKSFKKIKLSNSCVEDKLHSFCMIYHTTDNYFFVKYNFMIRFIELLESIYNEFYKKILTIKK